MQYAIRGTYQSGQVVLNELPPNDEMSEVMVVFLSKSSNSPSSLKTANLFGIAKNNSQNDDDIEEILTELSKNSEQHILQRWDKLNNE